MDANKIPTAWSSTANLWGTTVGGVYNPGTIFKVAPQGGPAGDTVGGVAFEYTP